MIAVTVAVIVVEIAAAIVAIVMVCYRIVRRVMPGRRCDRCYVQIRDAFNCFQ